MRTPPALLCATVNPFPKVDVEEAGMATHDLASRGVCLFREEYIYLFDPGHNIGVSLDRLMMNDLTHLDEVR